MSTPTSPIVDTRAVAVDKLAAHPRNYRKGDVDAIARSLEAHGQYRPIVARQLEDGTYQVLAGHHVLYAARKLGWLEVSATIVDVTNEQALELVVVDNRSHDLGGYDERAYAEAIASLTDPARVLFTPADVDELVRRSGLLGDQLTQNFNETRASADAEVKEANQRLNDQRAEQGLPPVRTGLEHSEGGTAYVNGADLVQFCVMFTTAQRDAVVRVLRAERDREDSGHETYGDALLHLLGVDP